MMEILEAQNKIRKFDIARGWEKDWNIKDLMLNITEETGEAWNLIKWIDDEKQKKVVIENKSEVSDYIGDTMFLLLKIANQTGVDSEKALQDTLDEYEKRMPPEIMRKVGHANKLAGGIDNKKTRKQLTLCLVQGPEKILLGMKKRGFGKGRWNGFGGKVEEGESIEQAAIRELREEAGIKPESINKRGVIEFEFEGNPEILEVHIFNAEKFIGNPEESEEMRPQWFKIDEIPFSGMWPDDRHWLPLLIAGKKFRGRFLFRGENEIIDYKLNEVNEI